MQLNPSTGGRPSYALTLEIEETIRKLANHGCSQRLIADFLGIDPSVFTDNIDFSNTYKKYYSQAGVRVHHRQFELLESDKEQTAALMAIWLGKQILGQSDRVIDYTHQDIQVQQTIQFVLPDGIQLPARRVIEATAEPVQLPTSPEPSSDTPSNIT